MNKACIIPVSILFVAMMAISAYGDSSLLNIIILSPQNNNEINTRYLDINVTTDKNATCWYSFSPCSGRLGVGTDFDKEIDIYNCIVPGNGAWEQELDLSITCIDGFDNELITSSHFNISINNTPPVWTEEPQDIIIAQGSSNTLQLKAHDPDGQELSYYERAYTLGNPFILFDNNRLDSTENAYFPNYDLRIYAPDKEQNILLKHIRIKYKANQDINIGINPYHSLVKNYPMDAPFYGNFDISRNWSQNQNITYSYIRFKPQGDTYQIVYTNSDDEYVLYEQMENCSNQTGNTSCLGHTDLAKGNCTIIFDANSIRIMANISQYDEFATSANDFLVFNVVHAINGTSLEYIGTPTMFESSANPGEYLAYTNYGAFMVSDGKPDNSTVGQEIMVMCPSSQVEQIVIVEGNGQQAKFKTGSDILSLNERIGTVKQTFTSNDLPSLLKIQQITVSNSLTPVKQYLFFDNSSGVVNDGPIPNDDTYMAGNFLRFTQNTTISEYLLEFTQGALSAVQDGYLVGLERLRFEILGAEYSITKARIDNTSIELTLVKIDYQTNQYVRISSNGTVTIAPPANYSGSFILELSVSDGYDTVLKDINVTVIQADQTEPPAATSQTPRGNGGGGSSSIQSTKNWTCGAWSECIDGKQKRNCTLNIARKSESDNCTEKIPLEAKNEINEEVPDVKPAQVDSNNATLNTTVILEKDVIQNANDFVNKEETSPTGMIVGEQKMGNMAPISIVAIIIIVLIIAGVLFYGRKLTRSL